MPKLGPCVCAEENTLTHILLTGAGFSRNWGGWLANEAFEYLLGCPEITSLISAQLWKAKTNGSGFEGALDALRGLSVQHKDDRHKAELKTFEEMLLGMFSVMNNSYMTIDLERAPGTGPAFVRNFLCRFDKIFTLNQDTLLEQHYQHSELLQGSNGQWLGFHIPGLKEIEIDPGLRTPASPPYSVPDRHQPYFKLHGSSNWRQDNKSLLIMGGNKPTDIAGSELLSWYEQQFRQALREPGARLMVIGYSFRDTHINEHIKHAAATGLKLFIIDPNGLDVIQELGPRGIYNFGSSLQGSIIGASRRDLRATLTTDKVEQAKVMRFFS